MDSSEKFPRLPQLHKAHSTSCQKAEGTGGGGQAPGKDVERSQRPKMDQRSVANRREWEGGGGGVQQPMYPPIGGDDSAQASTPITVTVVSSEAGTAAADGADDKLRMRVNGETPAQLAHARMRKARTTDTTVDEVWPIDDSLKSADSYVKFCTLLYLIPKFIILLIPMLLLAVPFALISRLYAMFLPYGTDQVERKAPGFLIYFFSASLSLMPLSFFWAWSRISDCVFYYIFGLPYLIFSKDGWARRQRSLDAIRPHMNGPRIRLADVMVCALGHTLRNGTLEFALSFTIMILAVPWLKYFVNANTFVYDLKERFVQQISTSMQDMPIDDVVDAARRIISRCKHSEDMQDRLDRWVFCPHYPYPPRGRRWAIGMQSAGNRQTLLTHATHAGAEASGITDQFVYSNSVERPIWRVMLWYNNPYHFLTGFVEASVSHGRPSQTDKALGGEHPMWLVSSHSPLHSERHSMMLGPGRVDRFFDNWLPVFVDEVRALNRGADIAKAMHQEVVSKDGISRPAAAVGPGPGLSANPRLEDE